MSTMPSGPAPAPVLPRAAATVVLLRDAEGGVETCLLRRHARSTFVPEAWVFPGGTVEDADRMLPPAAWTGIDLRATADRFGGDSGVALGLHVAAVRETFEEAGVLLGRHRDGSAVQGDVLAAAGTAQVRRGLDFAGWLTAARLAVDLGALTYWRRWVTPTSEPRRYDTAFFLARAPHGQEASHDGVETTEQRWVRPADALAAADAGRVQLVFPTRRSLEELAAAPDVDAVLASVGSAAVRPVQPHVARLPDGSIRISHPDDPDFPADAGEVVAAW